MPSQKDNIKDKMPFIIYAGLESLIKKSDGCADNPKKS